MIVKPAKPEYMGGIKLPAGIKPEEWDVFHNIVAVDEMNRYTLTLSFYPQYVCDMRKWETLEIE